MIVCCNITKTYLSGNVATHALKDVSFSIHDGEFVAIMGPSGSGKSTLMHMLGCLDTPTSGTYELDGRYVSELLDDELARMRAQKIGFVFQAFNLLPRTSVERNVMLPLVYGGVPEGERRERTHQALRDAAFPEQFWQYHSNQLSGGMMQRVAIARALVNDPTMILADEPTGNLDSATGEQVLATFARLHAERGRTVVLITHEQSVAEHAKRIIVIRDGAIAQDYATS